MYGRRMQWCPFGCGKRVSYDSDRTQAASRRKGRTSMFSCDACKTVFIGKELLRKFKEGEFNPEKDDCSGLCLAKKEFDSKEYKSIL